jgi:two-component system, OmpR family, KDP operon response regulator KdpE
VIRRFLRAGFELHGYIVLEAKDARGGLKAARSNAIDLIILDLGLPDLEGSEVLERIRLVKHSGHHPLNPSGRG